MRDGDFMRTEVGNSQDVEAATARLSRENTNETDSHSAHHSLTLSSQGLGFLGNSHTARCPAQDCGIGTPVQLRRSRKWKPSLDERDKEIIESERVKGSEVSIC